MLIPKKYLYLIAALIWGIPGITITLKGVNSYRDIQPTQRGWLLAATVLVGIFFYVIFRRVTKRYINHISSLPDRCSPHRTFPMKGWLLILFMMCLGIILKSTPGIPIQFTASFYSGLGPMLILASFRFLLWEVQMTTICNQLHKICSWLASLTN